MNDNRHLDDRDRRDLFHQLVQLQDAGAGLRESRRAVAERFGCTVAQARAVERQGLAEDWPLPSRGNLLDGAPP
jgi:hypothetical protein